MGKVYITAHRGMGVTAKPRDKYIKNAKLFPENSIAAFKEAANLKADAFECDIHVSKDGVAMVIHGDKITDYAYYIGSDEKAFEKDSNKTCRSYLREEIQTQFVLKNSNRMEISANREDISNKDASLSEYRSHLKNDPDFYQIPTLNQLLNLVVELNQDRLSSGLAPLKLNIELKGKDWGFITLATIIDFNKIQLERNKPCVSPSDLILLGKIEVNEVRIAKSLLKGTKTYLSAIDGIQDKKQRHALLSQLFGVNEIEAYLSRKDLRFYLTENDTPDETTWLDYLKNAFPDDYMAEKFSLKCVVLTKEGKVFFAKNKKFFRNKTQTPTFFQFDKTIIQELISRVNMAANFFEVTGIISYDLNDEINNIIQPEAASFLADNPEEYHHGKIVERIGYYQKQRRAENNSFSSDEHFHNFLLMLNNANLEGIRANLMLSTSQLYGEKSLISDNEDFDVKSEISIVSPNGLKLIGNCFE